MPITAHTWRSCGNSCMPGAHTTCRIVRSSAWCSNVRPPSLGCRTSPIAPGSDTARATTSRTARLGSGSAIADWHAPINTSMSNISASSRRPHLVSEDFSGRSSRSAPPPERLTPPARPGVGVVVVLDRPEVVVDADVALEVLRDDEKKLLVELYLDLRWRTRVVGAPHDHRD